MVGDVDLQYLLVEGGECWGGGLDSVSRCTELVGNEIVAANRKSA